MKNRETTFTRILDACEEIIAFFTVIILALIIINAFFDFLPEIVRTIFMGVKEWAGLALIGITGLECALKRNKIILIIFLLFLTIVVVFMCIPDAFGRLMGLIPYKK